MPCEAPPCAPVGWVPAGAPRGEPANASAWVRTKRDQSLRPQGPTAEAINLSRRTGARRPERSNSDAPDGCPTAEGPTSNSNRRTGPGTESYVKSVGSGPCCLRRATSNPQRQHSLVGDPSRERIRSVRSYPGNRDRAPKISMVGNLGKAKQHGHYHSLRSIKRGLAAPPRRFSPNC